ncbi:hypothetical protein AAC387_Pa04g1437 [Persea americana]
MEAFARSACIQAATSASSSASCSKTSPGISCAAPSLTTSCSSRKPVLCLSPERKARTSSRRTPSDFPRPFPEDCFISSSFLESPRYAEKLSTNHFVKPAV